jgi:hypothetical protein
VLMLMSNTVSINSPNQFHMCLCYQISTNKTIHTCPYANKLKTTYANAIHCFNKLSQPDPEVLKLLHIFKEANPNIPQILKWQKIPITITNRKEHTMSLEDPKDFAASDKLNLSNSMRISKNNTDLRWSQTLLCKLANSLFHL